MKLLSLTGQYGVGKYAMVDDADFEHLNQYNWYLTGNGYPCRTIHPATGEAYQCKLHRYLMGFGTGNRKVWIDHVDGNTLNCQKDNLRFCKPLGNAQNRRLGRDNTSGYKGVSERIRQRGTIYSAQIRSKDTTYWIGTYNTSEEAAMAYDKAALQHHGRFARLNFPDQALSEVLEGKEEND